MTVNNEREIWQTRPIGGATGWGAAFAEVEPGTVLAQKLDGTLWLIHDDWKDEPAVRVDKKVNWKALAFGEFELLALAKNGQLWRYEDGSKQRVGLGTAWRTVSVSKSYSLAVARDGTLWSWGEGRAGELGTIYAGEQRSPVRIGKDANWVKVFAADDHSLALKTDGSLWAWGNNLHGQLGDDPPIYRTVPSRLVLP